MSREEFARFALLVTWPTLATLYGSSVSTSCANSPEGISRS
jgi:hypothetical protein